MNIFEKDVSDNKIYLKKKKTENLFLKIFSFGLCNKNEQVKEAEFELAKSLEDRSKYNDLLTTARSLDKSLSDIIVIKNARISRLTFSDFSSIDSPGYPSNWEELRLIVLERDGFICQEFDGNCQGPLQIHHKLPLSKGGTNSTENLVTLCFYHHTLKHDHMRTKLNGYLWR